MRAGWRWSPKQSARAQRLLWASTGTKDPRFSEVLYVESLIGPDTVDTIPPATLDALRDHGKPRNRLGREHRRRQADTSKRSRALASRSTT